MRDQLIIEIAAKEGTIRKLQLQLGKKERQIFCQKREINNLSKKVRKLTSEQEPLRESLNNLTDERGKWLRKLKRAGIKGDR